MCRLIFFFILLSLPLKSFGHIGHYENFEKIKMEVFKDGKSIGYSTYKFLRKNNILEVHNNTNFKVKILGMKVFEINSDSVEKYKDGRLIFFESETLQNDKKKHVNLKLIEEEQQYYIEGSSYKGKANLNVVIGNWWNHKILESEEQISPISGSIKKQVVTFLKKEKIIIYGKEYLTHKFKLKSQDPDIEIDKKLDFDIWVDPNSNLILKVNYDRLGKWEYILKEIIKN